MYTNSKFNSWISITSWKFTRFWHTTCAPCCAPCFSLEWVMKYKTQKYLVRVYGGWVWKLRIFLCIRTKKSISGFQTGDQNEVPILNPSSLENHCFYGLQLAVVQLPTQELSKKYSLFAHSEMGKVVVSLPAITTRLYCSFSCFHWSSLEDYCQFWYGFFIILLLFFFS